MRVCVCVYLLTFWAPVGMCTRASAKRMTRTHGGHDGGGWCVGGVRRAVLHEVKIGGFAAVLFCGKDTWFINIVE